MDENEDEDGVRGGSLAATLAANALMTEACHGRELTPPEVRRLTEGADTAWTAWVIASRLAVLMGRLGELGVDVDAWLRLMSAESIRISMDGGHDV